MDIVTMHQGVHLSLQQINAYAFEDFKPHEIDYYLNDAINKYVKAQVAILRDEKDKTRVRIANDNLWSIVKDTALGALASHGELPKVFTATLPADFHLFLGSQVTDGTDWWRCNLTTSKDFLAHLPTKRNTSPIFHVLPVIISDGKLNVALNALTTTVNNLQLVYVSEPDTVLLDAAPANNVACNLPDHTHQEIIDLCVNIMASSMVRGRVPEQRKAS
jgi:hypothetical protein